MKNKLAFLLLLFVSLNICLANETEKLPEVPWKAIVESQKGPNQVRWETDVYVKMFGNYSKSDSLMVENAIEELNKLVQTIHIRMSPCDRGNLELIFIDSTNHSNYKHIITLQSYNKKSNYIRFSASINRDAWLASQGLNLKLIPESSRQNFLTNTLAFDLYPTYWYDELYQKKKVKNEEVFESIFRSMEIGKRDKIFLDKMQEFDKELLSAVYSHDFEDKLKIAQKQFDNGSIILTWLKVSPHFLILPFGILSLLLVSIYLGIIKRIANQVSNELLRFNINGIIGLLLTAIILTLYFRITRLVQYNQSFSDRLWHDLRASIILMEFIGLMFINLLRIIEIRIHKNTHRKLLRIALIFLATGLLPVIAFFAMYLFETYRDRPIILQNRDIERLSYIFIACMIVAAFRALISYFFFKEKDLILENETKLSNLRELKTKAELNALHSRINPHFLYNSLNSIAGLAHEDADKTEHMALSLSKLFRYSINRDQSDWTTFKEEMEMIKIYLEVEKVRFDDRLSYSVELPHELEDFKIPRFMIQPLVENAVKHGISKSVESGQIKVAVKQEGRKIFISVSDDGPAFPKDLAPGFGIQSIYDKLEILYNEKFEMNFINSPHKQALIKLS